MALRSRSRTATPTSGPGRGPGSDSRARHRSAGGPRPRGRHGYRSRDHHASAEELRRRAEALFGDSSDSSDSSDGAEGGACDEGGACGAGAGSARAAGRGARRVPSWAAGAADEAGLGGETDALAAVNRSTATGWASGAARPTAPEHLRGADRSGPDRCAEAGRRTPADPAPLDRRRAMARSSTPGHPAVLMRAAVVDRAVRANGPARPGGRAAADGAADVDHPSAGTGGRVAGAEGHVDRETPDGVPEPGPPSARRRQRVGPALRERLPLWVQTRCGLERRSAVALSVLLVVAVGFAAQHFWAGRTQPVRAPEVVRAAVPQGKQADGVDGPPPDAPADASRAAGSAAPGIVVDVSGTVRQPGIHRLPAGSRVEDALRAAGGVRPGTKTETLNRARFLVDGEQVVVGGPPPAGVASGAAPGTAATAAPTAPVSLNTATLDQLDSLPGVGPVLAQHIVDHRTRNGGFRSVDELREVNGIGDRRFADLRHLVRP